MTQSVSDTGSNTGANIARAVQAIGRSQPRLAVFEAIYFHKKPVKTVAEVAARTGLERKIVLTHGKHLVGSELVHQEKINGDTAYRTIPFYQHHKQQILRFVADPSKLEKTYPQRGGASPRSISPALVTKQVLRKKKAITVLYLYANPDPSPDPQSHIRPEAEANRVLEAVQRSKFRNNLKIEMRPGAGRQTLINGLNDFSPEIVHFSGHSNTTSLAADNGAVGAPATEEMPYRMFAMALGSVDRPPIVTVLNSCFSASARHAILEHVPFMIGMAESISDNAATAFATQFYAGLASGQSVRSAFNQGVFAVTATSLNEEDTPMLFEQAGADASAVKLT